jgi:hypothetical protein
VGLSEVSVNGVMVMALGYVGLSKVAVNGVMVTALGHVGLSMVPFDRKWSMNMTKHCDFQMSNEVFYILDFV